MKSFLTIALATLSLSSFAGTLGHPDQDPVVRATAQLFDDGETPTAGFLLNNKFSCVMMNAERGNFEKTLEEGVEFKRLGKMFYSDEMSQDLFFLANQDNNEMVATAEGSDSEKMIASLRMNTDENVLVMEVSRLESVVDLTPEEKSDLLTKFAEPQADILTGESDKEVAVVTGYALCSIE